MFDRLLQHLAKLAVANLETVYWDSSAFNSLIILKDKKDIVQSLVKHYTTNSNQRLSDNIIQEKDQNLVILLQYDSDINSVFLYSQLTLF